MGFTCILAGCISFQTRQTAAQFDDAVHTAAASERALFREVQAADCNDQFYREAFRVAGFGAEAPALAQLDLTGAHCTHGELTDEELAIREKLLGTLTLYADAIRALSDGQSDAELDSKEKTAAGDIKSLAAAGKFGALEKSGAAGLDAAVSAVLRVSTDRRDQRDVESAAGGVQNGLALLVQALQMENDADVKGLASKYGSVSNELYAALRLACEHGGAGCFLGIAAAHATLVAVIVAPPDAEKLNKTLDALLQANASLAQPRRAGARADVAAFAEQAQQAAALFTASK